MGDEKVDADACGSPQENSINTHGVKKVFVYDNEVIQKYTSARVKC